VRILARRPFRAAKCETAGEPRQGRPREVS
jgi:hypothetical protein